MGRAHLESKDGLSVAKNAPCYSAACTLSETTQLYYPAVLARSLPSRVVQIFDVQRSSLLQAQLFQIWQQIQTLQAVPSLHTLTASGG